jgi:hypothetical protein
LNRVIDLPGAFTIWPLTPQRVMMHRMSWQNSNLQAAGTFLRERIGAGDSSPRTKAIYEGLLEVLDPTRRATRVQREMAAATLTFAVRG